MSFKISMISKSQFLTLLLLCVFLLSSISNSKAADPGAAASGAYVGGAGDNGEQGQEGQKKVVPGCDEKVMKVLKARAKVKTIVDEAAIDEVMTKPDSVLAITCFGKAAKASSKGAGKIFSGNFFNQLKGVLKAGLKTHYKNFTIEEGGDSSSDADESFYDIAFLDMGEGFSAGGGVSAGLGVDISLGMAGGGGVAPGPVVKDFKCDNMNKVWKKASERSTVGKIPHMSEKNLEEGTAPAGAGKDFQKKLKANKSAFNEYKQAKAALKQNAEEFPKFEKGGTSCNVMVKAGIKDESECDDKGKE